MDAPPTKKIKGCEVGMQTEPNMKRELDEESFNKMHADSVLGLMEKVAQQRPKVAWKITLELILNIYRREVRSSS